MTEATERGSVSRSGLGWNRSLFKSGKARLGEALRRAEPRSVSIAILATFLLSGLVHDLILSVPAGGGYGFPTLYFLVQGAAVLLERSKIGRRLGLARGAVGWWFMMGVTAGPVALLFHRAFLRNVMIPFLQIIGST